MGHLSLGRAGASGKGQCLSHVEEIYVEAPDLSRRRAALIRRCSSGEKCRVAVRQLSLAKGAKGLGFQLLGASVVRHQCRITPFACFLER